MLGFTLRFPYSLEFLLASYPPCARLRVDLNSTLKYNERGVSGAGGNRASFGKTLVVVQLALSLVSLIVAGLLIHSFQKLTHVEVGYDSDHILQFGIGPNPDNYKGSANQLHKELLERIRLIPGVRGASLSLTGLFSNINLGMNVSIPGNLETAATSVANDFVGRIFLAGRIVVPSFWAAKWCARRRERPLSELSKVARTYFGDANPIGPPLKASATFGHST